MATVTFEHGTWSNFWGYTCSQCGKTYPFLSAAVAHEEAIDDNDGECPKLEKEIINENKC